MSSGEKFKLQSDFVPAGDQPLAIKLLVDGLRRGERYQTLFGVTGSGKTFTIANVIAAIQKPTLVIAHNKTLAAQLAQEYRDFFPSNAVHYFVSYYDFYQPEAYLPITDTYIEKEAQINEEIDRLRHAATQALLTRRDVIIVASVSCIYGLGSPTEYEKVNRRFERGMKISRSELIRSLIGIYFTRTNTDLKNGTFRVIGQNVEIMPTGEEIIWQLEFAGDKIEKIRKINPITHEIMEDDERAIFIFPAKHFVTARDNVNRALKTIKLELAERLKVLKQAGKILEAERLKRRTNYDLALIREIGYTNGIENYSRHFSGKAAGEPPDTLLSYFPRTADGLPDFLTVIDESHVTVPQIKGMYAGDQSRKKTLIEHGFRLPSAADNRPLKFSEFEERVGPIIFTSATPGEYERQKSKCLVEQIIRPTGLVDPQIIVRPITGKNKKHLGGQINDFIKEAKKTCQKGGRVIVTTLTKRMAEDLTSFLKEQGLRAEYLHSDIETLERVQILSRLRRGDFDILVGVNLLREGLDLPEVSLIGILDADKEGFLRSETSLIQIIGRAARNINGTVILYADYLTESIKKAIQETNRRRALQIAYNKKHGITPKTVSKSVRDITEALQLNHQKTVKELLLLDEKLFKINPRKLIKEKEKQMNEAIKKLDFESAAILRDELIYLEKIKSGSSSLSKKKRKKVSGRGR
jgi:excinuclease ABC subunit B